MSQAECCPAAKTCSDPAGPRGNGNREDSCANSARTSRARDANTPHCPPCVLSDMCHQARHSHWVFRGLLPSPLQQGLLKDRTVLRVHAPAPPGMASTCRRSSNTGPVKEQTAARALTAQEEAAIAPTTGTRSWCEVCREAL